MRRGTGRGAAALALLMLCGCSGLRSDAARARSARVSAENAVLIASRVPKSVVFRNEVVSLRGRTPIVCGEYNGMNRNREWVGFSRFIYAGGEITFDLGQPEFAGRWASECPAPGQVMAKLAQPGAAADRN